MLIEGHKEKRVDFSRNFFRRYVNEKNNFLDSIVNEIRPFYFTPDTKTTGT